MGRRFDAVVGVIAAVAAIGGVVRTHAQSPAPLAGVWTLNRSLSTIPAEIGFTVAWLPSASGDAGGSSGAPAGRGGRRGSGGGGRGGGAFSAPRESYEDAQRVQILTAEARKPSPRLMILDTPAAVTFTNDLGQSRVLHPDGKQDDIEFQGVLFPVTAKRDGDQLVAIFHVQRDRDIRYTYSHSAAPAQLTVEVEFIDHGTVGDKEKCVYEPGVATETSAAPVRSALPPGASSPPPGTSSLPPSVPASGSRETFDERPGAELKGIKTLGILVEDVSTQAQSCGLNHDALESAISKRLTGGGFDVRRNSDDDTYVYVNVMTNTQSSGTCVSRYDVYLYTHATAKVSYHDQPVLVQVSLIHRGGIGSSAPSGHAAAVTRGLENYVDLVMTQIRDANK